MLTTSGLIVAMFSLRRARRAATTAGTFHEHQHTVQHKVAAGHHH